MKNNIHPIITNTLIQSKDGSSYNKHWSYLRSTLVLEGGSKKWEKPNHRYFIDSKKIYEFSKNIENFSQIKLNQSSFWFIS